MSWWTLGEGHGYRGGELELFRITCPFCMERGNFSTAFHAEKKKSNSDKTLNFDTLECGNCRGYVMVLWSASEYGYGNSLYNYRVLPWPQNYEKYPEHWPDTLGRYWIQAKRSLKEENWDAAALMARSALQFALRDHGAKKGSLKSEIADLYSKGILPPNMKDWSEEVRELGNESAHPSPSAKATDQEDARDIVKFLDFLAEYLYDLPHQISEYRKRNTEED